MDKKIEGYLIAGMALIPTGIGMITAATTLENKIIGLAVTVLGIVCVILRGQEKDKVEVV